MSADMRPRTAGFGGLFMYALAASHVAEVPELNDADLLLSAVTAADAPTTCPLCECPAVAPRRDENGDWTWDCCEGCNP